MVLRLLPLLRLIALQQGWLSDAQFRAVDGYDDFRTHGRRAVTQPVIGQAEVPALGGGWSPVPGAGVDPGLHRLPDRETDLDAELGDLQHRLDAVDAGRLL